MGPGFFLPRFPVTPFVHQHQHLILSLGLLPPPPLHNHPPHPSHPSGRRSLLWSPVAARPARLTCRPPLHSLAAPRLLPRLQPTLDPASPPGACLDLLHFLCLGGVASNDVAD